MIKLHKVINQQLTTTATGTVWSPAENVRAQIQAAAIVSVATEVVSFDAFLTASGAAGAVANKVINSKAVQINETYNCPELIGQILNPGEAIRFQATITAKLNCHVSAIEIN